SVEACAGLVSRGDPERFASAMTAPLPLRGDLMVLYAFNLEVAKAPWVTSEAMLAEMRLQWWIDALDEIYEGKRPRAHEVVTPLADVIGRAALPKAPFEALIQARRGDIYPEAPVDWAAVWAYLEATGGGLMALAAQILGADEAWCQKAQDFGTLSGAASLIRAVPELEARGRRPLPGPAQGLALEALGKLDKLNVPRGLRPAFAVGSQTKAILKRAARGDSLETSEFSRRWALLWVASTGRI
ncbi:MAG: squalene/phytoene synthase family protein, partial [Pseudomonadota bacterium]